MLQKKNRKKAYLNPVQLKFLKAKQKTKTLIAGRGLGKSVAIGANNQMKASVMPRAKCFFASTTYNQILTKTLPAVLSYWSSLGLIEHEGAHYPGHFIIGKKPPRQWVKPYSPPRNYKNVITFFNGYTIEMLSMDRPDLARGGSYDGGDIDEAALIKRKDITTVLLPSIRGNRHYFSSWMHQQVAYYTSMPWKTTGAWVLEYEEKALLNPELYYYLEGTAYDNIAILGEEGIERLRAECTYLEFAIEVMNERIKKLADGFYHAFNEELHCYTPKYKYGESENGITVEGNKDINTNKLFDISLDFGGWINLMTIYQQRAKTEYMVDSLFVKDDKSLNVLIDDFCVKYADHKCKHVRLWGEPRGHDKNPTGDTWYSMAKKRFEKNGWRCEIKAKAGRTDNHEDRYNFINDLLTEEDIRKARLRINQETCKAVIIAIQSTRVKPDGKKDKSDEKKRDFQQEHAPHFTDTIDYYLKQKHGRLIIYGGGSVTFA